jgi:hypothetical protein
MKYVAFLDMLGFKDRLKKATHADAQNYIQQFSSIIYKNFQKLDNKNSIRGYVFSDSLILYSMDVKLASLLDLIKLIQNICKDEFIDKGFLIRGSITRGQFDEIIVDNLVNLRKGLIVGTAFIEAYSLESSEKVIGITLSKPVYEDLYDNNYLKDEIENDNNTSYFIRYIDLDFLLSGRNLYEFIKLAVESEWRPHYYNAIYLAIKNESNDKKVEDLFIKVENIIVNIPSKVGWRALDDFIENAFAKEVQVGFKKRFLKHIRNRLVDEA